MSGGLAQFVGVPLGLALIVTGTGAVLLWFAGRPPRRAGMVLSVLLLFFLGLTQLPLPDPAAMVCPQTGVLPRLDPLHLFRRLSDIAARPWLVLRLSFVAALMNLVLCGLIGAALACWRPAGIVQTAVFGIVLTLGVELTQLTAFWGLFPCPWRTFDVNDLLLNLSGVLCGFATVRYLGWLRRVPDQANGQE